ncbi:hypothetical protein [Herbaspirillum chlorophenolicum]|uniref:hypothetical protein n=1 Tax=Herbaspirillum chlorophenolicum TaxID=211589 RepID=UPI000ACF0085|nr:hypothetical protein [Herbaspirillum chlorophenolicum]
MDGQRGLWYARCQKVLSIAIFSISLTACGSITPTGLAWVGKPDALIHEVLAGRIDPNGDYLTETNQPNTRTPLCVLAPQPSAAVAVDYLLAHGADVNKPCSQLANARLPVDEVLTTIYLTLAEKSPYDPDKYFRDRIPANMDMLKKLIQRGGTNKEKTIHSMDDAGTEITRLVRLRNKNVADELENIRIEKNKAKQDSWFTIETLSSLVQVANLASQNYRATSGQSLPVIPAVPNSTKNNQSRTAPNNDLRAAATKTTTPTSAKPVAASACLPAGAIGDKSDITPACSRNRNNTFGWGDTRAAACEGATRSVREEFDGKNAGGCYCQANAKVNSVTQPYVCWVMFD